MQALHEIIAVWCRPWPIYSRSSTEFTFLTAKRRRLLSIPTKPSLTRYVESQKRLDCKALTVGPYTRYIAVSYIHYIVKSSTSNILKLRGMKLLYLWFPFVTSAVSSRFMTVPASSIELYLVIRVSTQRNSCLLSCHSSSAISCHLAFVYII